jgi:hypothetical protein
MWHRSVARHDLCLQHCRISRLAWDEDPLQGGRQTFCTAFAGVAGITSEWWPASVRTVAGIKSESRPASQIWEKYEAEESNDRECDVAVSIGVSRYYPRDHSVARHLFSSGPLCF